MTTPLKVPRERGRPPGEAIHFATRIDTDLLRLVDGKLVAAPVLYIGLCDYMSFDPDDFSNERGVVLQRQGGEITCEKCLQKINRCDGGNKA